MDVHDHLIPINRLLHVRVNVNLRHQPAHTFTGTENERAIHNALDIVVPVVMDHVINGNYSLPPDAPPLEPFGLCIRVMAHKSQYTLRLFSLRSHAAGLSNHYKWRALDVERLISFGLQDMNLNLDVWTTVLELNHLQCGEPGLLEHIRWFVFPTEATVANLANSLS